VLYDLRIVSRNADGASTDVEQLTDLPSEAQRFWRRARIVDAAVREVAEHGYGEATVASIAQRAGVPPERFYDEFGGMEDALIWAYDAAAAYAMPQILRALRIERDCRRATAAAVATYLEILDCDHDWALVCLRELPAAGERARAARDAVRAPVLEALRELVAQKHGEGAGVDAVLAGLDALVVDRLRHRPGKPLSARRRELTRFALAPFAAEPAGPVLDGEGLALLDRRPVAPVGEGDLVAPVLDRDRIERLLDGGPEALEDFELLVQAAVARREGPTLWHASVAMAARRAAGEPVPEAIARQALAGLRDAWFFGLPVEASGRDS
jgi:AcrR family transcriptional regulator